MSEIPPAEQSVNSIVETFHGLAESHAPMEAMVGKFYLLRGGFFFA